MRSVPDGNLYPRCGYALGIAVKMLGEATNPALQRIARPEGERPKNNFSKRLSNFGLKLDFFLKNKARTNIH
jgi:hypothetical protein